MLENIRKEQAEQNRSEHAYRHGRGYIHVGPMPMPPIAVFKREECEPVAATADETWHMLQPPKGHPPMKMRWHVSREWAHEHPGRGHRIAFRSDYLAAHGWKYIGPYVPPKEEEASVES